WFNNLIAYFKRITQAGHNMHALVCFRSVGTLTIEYTKCKNAIVTGTFVPILRERREQLPLFIRCPIKNSAFIAFIFYRAVKPVGSVERKPVSTRLHIFKTIWNLTLSE